MEIHFKTGSMLCDEIDYYTFSGTFKSSTLSIGNHGYIRFFYNGFYRLFHRWLFNYPIEIVEHLNGNKLDNRRINLRLSSCEQNRCNLNDQLYKNNTTGVRGVSFCKRDNLWRCKITRNGFSEVSYHKSYADAVSARLLAESKLNFTGSTKHAKT